MRKKKITPATAIPRTKFLASVSESKQAEDDSMTRGFGAAYRLFGKQTRKHYFVKHDEKCRLLHGGKPIKDSEIEKYAVSENGGLYASSGKFSAVVHSQFMGGGNVQCAGWLRTKNSVISYIDNDSGHYTPTLGQFLLTIHAMIKVNYLPRQFSIGFSIHTAVEAEIDNGLFNYLSTQADAGVKVYTCNLSFDMASGTYKFEKDGREWTLSVAKLKTFYESTESSELKY